MPRAPPNYTADPVPIVTTPEPAWVRWLPVPPRSFWKILGGIVALLLLIKFTHPSILLVGVAAGIIFFIFEKWRRKLHNILLLEVRLQGQRITNVPNPFVVPSSSVHIWSIPKELFEQAIAFGDFRPPMNTNGLFVCDYYDPKHNVIVYPDDMNWANWVFLTNTNDEIATYFSNLFAQGKAQEHLKAVAVRAYQSGELSAEMAFYAVEEVDAHQRDLMRNPKTFRNLFLYYKRTIPYLQHLLWEMQARFEERAHQLGATYALMTNGLPLRPELVKGLPIERADNDRIRMLNPDYDEDESPVQDTGLAEEGSGTEALPAGAAAAVMQQARGTRRR